MEAFIGELREVRSLTNAETEWLGRVYHFVELNLLPVVENPGVSVATLSGRLVRCLSEHCAQADEHRLPGTEAERLPLPLAYTLVSISDLCTKSHQAFSSSLGPRFKHLLSWPHGGGGEEARLEVGEEGGRLVGAEENAAQAVAETHDGLLPHCTLLLCGRVTDRASEPGTQPDGSLFLRDRTGALQCELSDFPAEWLGELVLLPCWSYVPGGEPRGPSHSYVEVHGDPLRLVPGEDPPCRRRPRAAVAALRPDIARCLLLACGAKRSSRAKFSLLGELLAVAPLLCIRGKSFFVLRLGSAFSTSSQSLASSSLQSVLCFVQTPSKLFWSSCLRPHEHYLITDVTMTTVNGTRPVFVVSPTSELHPVGKAHTRELGLKEALTACGVSGRDFQASCRAAAAARPDSLARETEGSGSPSNVISYRGVLTRVINAHGGLYELDGEVGLCLAYQQGLHLGRGLRIGATLEVHAAHLVRCPWPGSPRAVLVVCALGSVRVASFSPLASAWAPFRALWSAPVRALHAACLSPAGYFRLLHELRRLSERLCPDLITERCLTRWRPDPADRGVVHSLFLSPGERAEAPRCGSPPGSAPESWQRGWTGCLFRKGPKRDVYLEILEEPHRCVVTQPDDADDGLWQLPSMSEVLEMAEEESRKVSVGCCPVGSEPPLAREDSSTAARPGHSAESRKAWEFSVFGPKHFEPPVILVGVLRASARTGLLQLADHTAALDCLAIQPRGRRRTACWDTALLGCLVRLSCFSLVVERFTDARTTGTRQHLTRIYAQFHADKATVLYRPSGGVQLTAATGSSRPEPAQAGPAAERPPEARENVGRGDEDLSSGRSSPTARAASQRAAEPGPAAAKGTVGGRSEAGALRVRQKRGRGKIVTPGAPGVRGAKRDAAELVGPAAKTSRRGDDDDGGRAQAARAATSQNDGAAAAVAALPSGERAALPSVSVTNPRGSSAPGGDGAAAAAGVRRETRPGGPARRSEAGDSRSGPPSGGPGGRGSVARVVARVFVVTHKEALMLRGEKSAPGLSFNATVRILEETVPDEQRTTPDGPHGGNGGGEPGVGKTTQMYFVGEAVRWHSILHPGDAYQLLLPSEQEASLYCPQPGVPAGVLQAAGCPHLIQLMPNWTIRSLGRSESSSHAQLEPQPSTSSQRAEESGDHRLGLMNIRDILEESCEQLVSFTGQISERFCYHPHDRFQKLHDSASRKRLGIWLPGDPDLRFDVQDLDSPELSVSVYLDPSRFIYPLGLLPGATVAFRRLQRCTSRVRKNVYCKILPVSSIDVTSFADASASPLSDPWGDGAPTLQIADLLSRGQQRVTSGRLGCRVVRIRWLRLRWACAFCDSNFTQGQCSGALRGTCNSEEGSFTAKASVMVDDGTGHAFMYMDGLQVASLLALSLPQWEALHRHVLNTSGEASFSYSDKFSRVTLDGLTENLIRALCCSRTVSRPLCLRFRVKTWAQEEQQEPLRTFEFELKKAAYSTLMPCRPTLLCVGVRDRDPAAHARDTGRQES
ncbi:CST complex subunit CTC1 [Lampetra planeri]